MWRWCRWLCLPVAVAVAVGASLWAWLPAVPYAVIVAEHAVMPNGHHAFRFSDDGRMFAVYRWNDFDEGLRVWHAGKIGDIPTGLLDPFSFSFSPDGQKIAIEVGGSVGVWDAVSGRKLASYSHSFTEFPTYVSFSPTGQLFIYHDGFLHDAITGKPLHPVRDEEGGAFELNHARYAALRRRDRINLWSLSTGKLTSVFFCPDSDFMPEFCLSHDGKYLAGHASEHSTDVTVWTAGSANGAVVPYPNLKPVAISPNGQQLAATFRETRATGLLEWLYTFFGRDPVSQDVGLFDVATGEILGSVPRGRLAEFSPDGSKLAVVCDDGYVRLYGLPLSRSWFALAGWPLVAFGVVGLLMTAVGTVWK